MKEPPRLLSGSGPATELMTTGSVLRVPSAARQRALQFTGVAVGMSASGTAVAAGASSLVKSLVLSISLGTVGGGLVSLAVSETFSRFEAASVEGKRAPQPAPAARVAVGGVAPATAAAPLVVEAPLAEPPAAAAAVAPETELHGAASKTRAEPGPKLEAPPSASVGSFGETPARSSLVEEQRSIEAARASVARGDAAGALATLDGYDRAYPRKQFGPEALALRVQALAAAGQLGLARSLARDFEQRYPHHPLLARVQAVVSR